MEEIKKNRYIQGYDEKGHPVWKKRLPDDNVLTKRTRGEKILFGIVFAVFLMHCLSLLIPVVWMFFSALMTREEYVGAFVLPKTWQFSNFIDAFASLTLDDGTTFFGMIFNSIWYTGGMTALTVFMPTMTGYVMSKYKFRGRDALYTFVIFSMTVPIIGAGAATMKIYGMLGLLDSPLYVLWEGTGTSWGGMFLVYYGFFKSVSWAYAEAAEIDGAGPFTIFFRIMLDYGLPLLLKEAKGEVTYESETEKYDEKQVEMYYKLDELLMEIVNLLEEVITNEIINKSILCSLFNERVRELGDTSTSGKILSDGFLRDTPKYLENYERTELRRLRAKRQEKENKCKQNT